ncbi:RNA methyltransferase [Halobacteriales archaeon QS_8_69_26]|nr:MAG: RNA methyltransferase [Halobacteriales archaeon QS_8_69_26]
MNENEDPAGEKEEPAPGPAGDPPVVAVVDAKTPGNVGTVARAMKNFGFSDLKLVDPPPIDEDGEAYGFAGHARRDVLPNHDVITFEDLVENHHTVATTAITNEDATSHVRYPFATPADLAEELAAVEAPTALVFGREGTGLSNDEIARMDRVCSIPASPEYPVLNLGQAATVVLYELRGLALEETQLPDPELERADEANVDRLLDRFDALLSAIDHPEEKRAKAGRLMRRVVGRAHLTDREAITLTGIFRKAGERAAESPNGGELPREGPDPGPSGSDDR